MRIRQYIAKKDFDIIKNWVADKRVFTMWSANKFSYPLEKCNFESVLMELADKYDDCPFVATDDSGRPIGFFCYSVNYVVNEGMLKFIMVDNSMRGQGFGKEMLTLAVKYAFEITKADTIQLNVFSVNEPAKKCYESIGFIERSVAPNAITYKNESWDRCNMFISKT